MSSDVEKLQNEISEHKQEISELLASKKELIFLKQAMVKRLRSMISNIKVLRLEKAEKVDELKKHRLERDRIKAELKPLFSDLKYLNELNQKYGKQMGSRQLQREIDAIEWKIISGTIPFKTEQELTKQRMVFEEELEKAAEKDVLRKKKKDLRQNITFEIAKEREFHEEFVKHAKEADKFRSQITVTSEEIDKQKSSLDEVNAKLDKAEEKIKELKNKIRHKTEKIKKIKESKNKSIMDSKLKEVRERFKKKRKLTTDDLIVLGASGFDLLKE